MTYIAVLLVVTVIVAWKCRRWVQHWNLLDMGIRQMKEGPEGLRDTPYRRIHISLSRERHVLAALETMTGPDMTDL